MNNKTKGLKVVNIGKRIQIKRKAQGLSLDELAAKAGCSKGLITQWECGILPANLNGGAIARVKRILKVRASGPRQSFKAKPKAAKVKAPAQDSAILQAIQSLETTVAGLTRAIEAFDRHTRPASSPTGTETASNPNPPAGILATNSLDRRYPWQKQQAKA